MARYIARRLLQGVLILFVLSFVLFWLISLVPGGPLAGQSQARHVRPEKLEMLKRQLGLDKPLLVRYVIWLVGNDWMRVDLDGDGVAESYGTGRGLLRGDFGESYRTRQPVLKEIGARLPNTIYLMGVTLLIVAVIAIPLGVLSAIKQYSAFDMVATTLSFVGQAIPDFWLGLILVLVFYGRLVNPASGDPLLPAGGMQTLEAGFSLADRAKHLILPVTMGMVGWVAWYGRFLRSSMLDVINQDYIRTARAKGLAEQWVLYRHALKNAALPLVTILALDLPYIFAGSLYTELIFSWPGMGRLYYQAALNRDYPLLMAVLIIGTAVTFLSNLLADIAYAFLDPKIRYS